MRDNRTYRFALVELYTDLPQGEYEDVGDAIQDAILADPPGRAEAVRRVLDALEDITVEQVLFPGWTLVGWTVPSWVTARSAARTLVVEMLPPLEKDRHRKGSPPDDRGWRAFVLREGRAIVGPVFQLFYSGTQVGALGSPSQAAVELADQLTGRGEPDRRWIDPAWPGAALLMCGEVNVIYSPTTNGEDGPVVAGFPAFDLIMNPAHKPNWLDAMRRKRRYLSRQRPDAVLFMTANTHGPWVKQGKGQQNRRTTAAEAYRAGEWFEPASVVPAGDHRLLLFE
jgi:hypothetical protein